MKKKNIIAKELRTTKYKTWFVSGYDNYQPNATTVNEIKKHINNYKIKVFIQKLH